MSKEEQKGERVVSYSKNRIVCRNQPSNALNSKKLQWNTIYYTPWRRNTKARWSIISYWSCTFSTMPENCSISHSKSYGYMKYNDNNNNNNDDTINCTQISQKYAKVNVSKILMTWMRWIDRVHGRRANCWVSNFSIYPTRESKLQFEWIYSI